MTALTMVSAVAVGATAAATTTTTTTTTTVTATMAVTAIMKTKANAARSVAAPKPQKRVMGEWYCAGMVKDRDVTGDFTCAA